MIKEQWKPVFGAEHNYEVSDAGRVCSVDHTVCVEWRGTTVTRRVKGKLLKAYKNSKGYESVAICVLGKITIRRVHHLVLEAFVGLRPTGYECAHLNGKPSNNSVANLKWATRTENNSHLDTHGTRLEGEIHGMAKLIEDDVLRIREASLLGATVKDLATVWEVTLQNIWMIIRRKTWKCCP
jgi:hypothetical protein